MLVLFNVRTTSKTNNFSKNQQTTKKCIKLSQHYLRFRVGLQLGFLKQTNNVFTCFLKWIFYTKSIFWWIRIRMLQSITETMTRHPMHIHPIILGCRNHINKKKCV